MCATTSKRGKKKTRKYYIVPVGLCLMLLLLERRTPVKMTKSVGLPN